jgi:hypothetical protein
MSLDPHLGHLTSWKDRLESTNLSNPVLHFLHVNSYMGIDIHLVIFTSVRCLHVNFACMAGLHHQPHLSGFWGCMCSVEFA